jgi:hypothetical protein
MKNSKKAAMEMSVGTMVTIVLLMIVLVLGIFFIQKIFRSADNALTTIDSQTQAQLQRLFADDEQKKIALYPIDGSVEIKRGDTPKGLAFNVRNIGKESAEFSYITTVSDASRCGSTFGETDATNMLLAGSGSFPLGPDASLDLGRVIKFEVPQSAPICTITYDLRVNKGTETYTSAQLFVTIK